MWNGPYQNENRCRHLQLSHYAICSIAHFSAMDQRNNRCCQGNQFSCWFPIRVQVRRNHTRSNHMGVTTIRMTPFSDWPILKPLSHRLWKCAGKKQISNTSSLKSLGRVWRAQQKVQSAKTSEQNITACLLMSFKLQRISDATPHGFRGSWLCLFVSMERCKLVCRALCTADGLGIRSLRNNVC